MYRLKSTIQAAAFGLFILISGAALALPGDINHDGEVGVSDVQCVVLATLAVDGAIPPCLSTLASGDLDCSGSINVQDVQLSTSLALGSLNQVPGLSESADSDQDNVHDNCDINPDFFDPAQSDRDSLANLHCENLEVIKYDTNLNGWFCATDANTQLTETEVDAMVANDDYSTGAHTVDTKLTEAEVDIMVANNNYAMASSLMPVALNGSYLSLTDKPVTTEQIESWDALVNAIAVDPTTGAVYLNTDLVSDGNAYITGTLQSNTGIEFPDGTIQTTAATGGSASTGTPNYVAKYGADGALTESIIQEAAGGVGIDTGAGGAWKLSVFGGGAAPGHVAGFGSDATTTYVSLSAQSKQNYIYTNNSGTFGVHVPGQGDLLTVTDNGTLYVTSVQSPSDQHLKKNIETIPNALDTVEKLRGVTYNWRIDEENKSQELGVIAQEVARILPDLVQEHPTAGHKTIKSGQLNGLFIEAIKEQQTLIAKQQKQLDALESRLLALESR